MTYEKPLKNHLDNCHPFAARSAFQLHLPAASSAAASHLTGLNYFRASSLPTGGK